MKPKTPRKSTARKTTPRKTPKQNVRPKRSAVSSQKKKSPSRKPKPSGSKSQPTPSKRSLVLAALILVLIGILGTYAGILDRQIINRLEGKRWRLPSKIYSDSFSLYPGVSLKKSRLSERLRRLGYQAARHKPLNKGEYREEKDQLEIYLHDFLYPEVSFKGFPARITTSKGEIQRIVDMRDGGQEIFSVDLEPELITGLFEQVWEERRLIKIEDVPAFTANAVIATEDRNFYRHFGLDFRAIARAALTNIKAGRVRQGASTLTQQLVKNFFLTPKRTLSRKIQEALMALIMELRYTKDEILEAYLNEIYFGQRGSQGVYGVGEAAEFYFGKTVKELSLSESAVLAGLIRSPNVYAPHKDQARIHKRRDYVLKGMWTLGMISEEEFEEASSEPIEIRRFYPQKNDAPYFVDYLLKEIEKEYSLDILTSEGLLIFTTLDVEMQRMAEKGVSKGLARLEARAPSLLKGGSSDPGGSLQSCLVALEPQTGFIRAMVGGRDYRKSQFNRVVQARRQPGSLFKPIAYINALEGKGGSLPLFTPASLLKDEPIEVRYDGKYWSPKNFNDQYRGEVTLRTALEKSLNCATAWLGEQVGFDDIVETARDLGLSTPMEAVPSVVLGAFETIPMEMASAFGVFANQGVRSAPRAIKTVLDKDGNLLERRPMKLEQAVTPETAFLMTHILKGVFERGTARGASGSLSVPAAGKTGTTNDYRDAWFVGYTSQLVALVWVGFDQPQSINFTGSQAALPIWVNFMKGAVGSRPSEDFLPPPGVVFKKIDRVSGLLATKKCTDTIDEAFLENTEPREVCPLHGKGRRGRGSEEGKEPGIFGRIRDLFN